MSRRKGASGAVALAGPDPFPWPMLIRCGNCGAIARVYPFPTFEDGDVLIPDEDLKAPGILDVLGNEKPDWDCSEATMGGTIWCPNEDCSPRWGEALLRQMVFTSAWLRGYEPSAPVMPLLGGYPVDAIAFLESELGDFLEGPGPLGQMRPHWSGDGPIAPRGADFLLACGQLVTWMREAHVTGFVTAADLGIPSHDAGGRSPGGNGGAPSPSGKGTPAAGVAGARP